MEDEGAIFLLSFAVTSARCIPMLSFGAGVTFHQFFIASTQEILCTSPVCPFNCLRGCASEEFYLLLVSQAAEGGDFEDELDEACAADRSQEARSDVGGGTEERGTHQCRHGLSQGQCLYCSFCL